MRVFSLRQQILLVLLAFSIFANLSLNTGDRPSQGIPEETRREIVLELAGEVDQPGIYFFDTPPTLKEAITRAGGLRGAVLPEQESSEILETGTLLTVVKGHPGGTEATKIKIGRMEARKLLVFSIPLDLNRASEEDLCLIPGIGKALAREMINYRKRRRGFRSVQELKDVNGMGEKRYQELSHFFRCGDPPPGFAYPLVKADESH